MTTLDFRNGLIQNAFSFGNVFTYEDREPYGLCFPENSQNYPFILKGGVSNNFELEYSTYSYQLRNRLLNTGKLKEVMDSARVPMRFTIKQISYLIGKGFLALYNSNGNHKLLFIACVDGTKNITSIQQVKFYVSKEVYDEAYKAIQPAIKDLIAAHTGDVIMCNNILDYVGERLTFPKGVSLSELNKYKQAVITTCLLQNFAQTDLTTEPLVVETNHGTVSIENDPMETGMDTSDIIRALNSLPAGDPNSEYYVSTANTITADINTLDIELLDLTSSPDSDLPY